MYAIGYPVAFDARAELLDNLELTSITLNSSLFGSSANWMLHSPTMPSVRMTFWAVSLRRLYSRFVSVWEGATTMLSPVWIPIGSMFSMLQMMMQLSSRSLMTSYSTSFHFSRYSSIRTCLILL